MTHADPQAGYTQVNGRRMYYERSGTADVCTHARCYPPRVARVLRRASPRRPARLRCATSGMALSRLACTYAHETLIWAFECERHIFTYDLINGPDLAFQVSSVWRIPTAPGAAEKRMDRHPTQKPLRLVWRALLASTREGALVFDPLLQLGDHGGCGQGARTLVRRRGARERFRRARGAARRGDRAREHAAHDLGDAEGSSRR
jgi:hypothetical protein